MAWIATLDRASSSGALRAAFDTLAARPLPPAYHPPHGGTAGILRAHSMDAGLMLAVFRSTGSLHTGDALTWAERELVATTAARTAGCFY